MTAFSSDRNIVEFDIFEKYYGKIREILEKETQLLSVYFTIVSTARPVQRSCALGVFLTKELNQGGFCRFQMPVATYHGGEAIKSHAIHNKEKSLFQYFFRYWGGDISEGTNKSYIVY